MEVKVFALAQKYMQGNDPSHDIAHVHRVVGNAKKILAASDDYTDVNQDILVAVAGLHDCMDHKYVRTADLPARVAELKLALTSHLGFSESQADFILQTIDNISYTAEMKGGSVAATSDDPYLAIVRDADRLESIGAIGIARCFAYSGAVGRLLATNNFEVEKTARAGTFPDTPNASAVMHFYEKLLKLQDRFKTKAGKKMAAERHAFLLAFLDQIHHELE